MLTIQTYKLLKDIKNLEQPYILQISNSYTKLIISDYKLFNYDYFEKSFYKNGVEFETTYEQLEYLINEGYIKLEYDDKFIVVTHKGLHHWQISLIDFCHFLGKSVIVPILVTIATNLIMNYLK